MKNPSVPVWKPMPFLRVLPPFTGGILLQHYFELSELFILFAFLLSICLYFTSSLFAEYLRFRFPLIKSLPLLITVLLAGMFISIVHEETSNKNHISHQPEIAQGYWVKLTSDPEQKRKTYKAEATIQYYIKERKNLEAGTGKILLYFKEKPELKSDDQLLVYASLEPIAHTGNPGTFNYRDYLNSQGIYRQAFLDRTQFKRISESRQRGLLYSLARFRFYLLQQIKTYIPDRSSYGLAEALLIGYKNDLDPTVTAAYSNTGTMHVIAISGLHLGILYSILEILSNLIRSKKWNRWLRPVFILTGLWIFSWLAGANPSVLRSAVMFSGFVLAKALNRNSPSPNTLCAAAFLLFCYEPNWIFDTGCQLSFAAVAGIQWTWKPLYTYYAPRNYWLDQLWKMTSVTLAAQVFTLPLCLYYFHQFPTYFLITNLVAVPLSSLLLIGVLILCIATPLPWACVKIGWLLNYGIAFMNQFVTWMDQLPGATIQPIMIDYWGMCFLFGLMTSACAFFLYRSKKWCLGTLAFASVFALHSASVSFLFSQQHKLVVANNRKLHLFSIEGDRAVVWAQEDSGYYYYQNMKQMLQHFRVKDTLFLSVSDSGNFYIPAIKTAFFSGDFRKTIKSDSCFEIETLVLGKATEKQLAALLETYRPKQLIVLNSNNLGKTRRIEALSKKNKIKCWLMVDKGAFEKPL